MALNPQILMDFAAQVEFNKGSGDVGPGTTRQLRYSKATYLDLVRRWVKKTNQLCQLTISLYQSGSLVLTNSYGDSSSTARTGHALEANIAATFNNVTSGAHETDYINCPFADGVAPPREDADTILVPFCHANVTYSLKNAYCLQADWSSATDIWIVFDFSATSGSDISYLCSGGTQGAFSGPAYPNNYLGIDVAGGSAFPSATSSIPLGDGTTAAFFETPGGGDRFNIDNINTNV